MPSDFDPADSKTFVDVAVKRGLLDQDQAKTLLETSKQQGVPSSVLAVESGILKPVEAEIVEAFASPMDLAPGYELLDVLGYGALGVVYRARQPLLQRDVAIKAIMKGRLAQQNVAARFQLEGAAIGRLQHPNIVTAYDSGSHRDRLYLVMELVKGSDLRKRLDKGPMDVVTGLSIIRQAALGLAHALAHQIIHRDIKPGNIILAEAPAGYDLPPGVPLAKIADFGLARLSEVNDPHEDETKLTLTGAALGTPLYSAPEQLTADEVDHRADIYALGLTLFRVLSGEAPFEEGKVSKIIAAKVTGQPPRFELLPSDLDPRVKQLILDMIHHNPDQRIANYDTLIERIDAILKSPGTMPSARDASRTARRGDHGRSWRKWTIPVIGVTAFVAALGFLLPQLHSPPTPTLVPNGWEIALFDGQTVTAWTDLAGLWRSGVDEEGGRVLVGKGSAVRRFPMQDPSGDPEKTSVGARVGIDLVSADAAEVHFAFSGDDFGQSKRIVARFDREQVSLGSRDGLNGSFVPSRYTRTAPRMDDDAPSYHEFRIENHGQHWFVYFDGELLGWAAAESSAENHAMQLVASEGEVYFEGPSVFGLKQGAIE